jgi:hypothetical protein
MLMLVPTEDILKERTAGTEDQPVGGYLRILARQGHIKEVLRFSQLAQTLRHTRSKVVPLQMKLFCCHRRRKNRGCFTNLLSSLWLSTVCNWYSHTFAVIGYPFLLLNK